MYAGVDLPVIAYVSMCGGCMSTTTVLISICASTVEDDLYDGVKCVQTTVERQMQLKILEEGNHLLELAQIETVEIHSSCMFLHVNGGRFYTTKCD